MITERHDSSSVQVGAEEGDDWDLLADEYGTDGDNLMDDSHSDEFTP